jgi:MinD superfamily P-loop ATPase
VVISFASGKGGTGKTTIATSFALYLSQTIKTPTIQFLDCDVEEPNAAIFLKPRLRCNASVSIPVPVVDFSKCTYCGTCSEVCRYNAIAVVNKKVLLFPELCHGCGGCMLMCPEQVISETPKEIGQIEEGTSGAIEFMQGRLKIGEPMATPLIRDMKKRAFNQASDSTITIIDVPPGTSCPVIEAVKDSDFSVLVTEPTPFGLNDLVLAVGALRKLSIPFGVVINRDGIGNSGVEDYCKKKSIPVLMHMPMDKKIAIAYSKGIPIVRALSTCKEKFHELHQAIRAEMGVQQ